MSPNLNPLCNRDQATGAFKLPEDGWYQIAPVGEYPLAGTKIVQVLDQPALTAMVNRFNEESKQTNFPGILVDFDHFSYDVDKSSKAAGWITNLQNRADGLWAQIRWSTEGKSAVESGEYRFPSPTFLPQDAERLGNNRVRPRRLDTVGLTNKPNLRGMVPLSNRNTPMGEADAVTKTKGNMKSVCTALGLSADASEEAVLSEVTKLQNRSKTAEEAVTPLKNRVAEIETQNGALLTTQAESDWARLGNRVKPEAKESWMKHLMTNRAQAVELLESLPEPKVTPGTSKIDQPNLKVMHNREAAKAPTGNMPEEDKATERNSCVREYKNRTGCDFQTAWDAVQRQKPDLFK